MLEQINIQDVLFLDIETVPLQAEYEQLSEREQYFWTRKSRHWRKDQEANEVYERAGIYAEFGKIVCVTIGTLQEEDETPVFLLKSFYGHDEKQLLLDFKKSVTKFCSRKNRLLCAHNGKEFDYPYLCRRMLVHQIKLPKILQIHGKKPWEVSLLDTMDLWRFGDYKNYTSLDLLAHIFDIPTPKDDIDGSQVGKVYWEEQDLERIVAYCQKDVVTIAQLLLRFMHLPLLEEEAIRLT